MYVCIYILFFFPIQQILYTMTALLNYVFMRIYFIYFLHTAYLLNCRIQFSRIWVFISGPH